MKEKFNAVESTMLIPLMIKANETKSKKARIKDNKAVEIINTLGVDDPTLDQFMSHEGVIARTILFDHAAKEFINNHPHALCINLACGLDDRFTRVDNGKILWYDIDLNDVINLRQEFFKQEDRRKFLIGSMLEDDWVADIEKREDVLVIMEGVLMYFEKEEVKTAFDVINKHFNKATIISELMCKKATKMSSKHDTIKHTNATFKWGVDHGSEITDMFDNLMLLDEVSFNEEMKKYSIRGFLFAHLPGIKNMNDRMATFKFK